MTTAGVALSDELESLKNNFPQIQIRSTTSHFLTFTHERTVHARVKATLTFPQDYPAHALLVSISWVPPGLSKKLERELGGVAQDLALSSLPQVEAVVRLLVTFVDTNKFVPCWRELKQVVELFKVQNEESTIALNEHRGRIQLRFKNCGNQYFYACSITIDDNYPSTTTHENWGNACKLVFRESNFGTKIATALTLQAREFVRHMQDGMSAEKALAHSNPIKAPTQVDDDDERETNHAVISTNAIKGSQRNDQTVNVTAAVKQGNAHATTMDLSVNERKHARRTVTKITQSEWLQDEQRRLAEAFQLLEDHADPQPSLFPLISFLRSKIATLPEETCPICNQLALPTNPVELEKIYNSKQQKWKCPLQTHCGCWYHYGCLHKFMVEPPFGATCPSCGEQQRVYHPNWPADIKELERNWTTKQARQVEIDDAAMFL